MQYNITVSILFCRGSLALLQYNITVSILFCRGSLALLQLVEHSGFSR